MRVLCYIDPGFGSIILQSLVAGLLGIVFFFRAIRMKIAAMFSSLMHRDDPNKPDDPKP